jgi:hypothetical protein
MGTGIREDIAYQRGLRVARREQQKLLTALEANHGDVARTAAELGTDPVRVRRVKNRIARRPGQKQWPEETRAEAKATLEANSGNVRRTARELDLPVSTVRKWRDEWAAAERVRQRLAAG